MFIIELELTGKDAKEVSCFLRNEKDYALFRDVNNSESVIYFMSHGGPNGEILLTHDTFTLEQAAKVLAKAVKQMYGNVTHVFTISCYGGFQKACCVDGIRFSSIHDHTDRVVTRLKSTETYGRLEVETYVNQVV